MWDKILVAALVLAALALVAYRLWRVLTGRAPCTCPRARNCPGTGTCEGTGAEERRPSQELREWVCRRHA